MLALTVWTATSRPKNRSLQLDYATTLPITRRGIPLQSRVGWSESQTGNQQLAALARISSSVRGWRWNHTSRLRYSPGAENSSFGLGGRASVAKSLSKVRVRAGLDYDLAPSLRLTGIEAGIQGRLSKAGFFDLAVNHDTQSRQMAASASFTRQFGDIAVSATGGVSTSGEWTTGIRLSTALFFDRRAKTYRTAPPGLSRTGAIRAHVFDDFNDDGQFNDGDSAIEGASFIVDRSIRREETTSAGTVILGGIEPNRAADVEIGLGSLDDPFLQPREKGVAVTVRPGQVVDVDIPLAPTGEVEATILIQKDDIQVPVAGVTLQAINETGDVVAEANSEYDGYVYMDGLPLGAITLRISPDALAEIDATSSEQSLALDRDTPSAQGLIFLVDTRQTSAIP